MTVECVRVCTYIVMILRHHFKWPFNIYFCIYNKIGYINSDIAHASVFLFL